MSDTATTPKMIRRLNVDPLPSSLEGLVPPAVLERSRELADASAKAVETAAAARAANEGVADARAADEAAAVEAAERSETLPKPTLPKAEERAQQAGRVAAAYVEVERRAKLAYLDVLRGALPMMNDAAEAELVRVGGDAAEHLDAVEAALVRSREVHIFLRALDPDSLVGREPSFTPARQGRQTRRSPISGEVREQLDGLRTMLNATAE